MRAYCRPGATAFERLESHVAHLLCSRPEMSGRLAELLVEVAGLGPARESAVRKALPDGCADHPGEALGVARAVLFFCGVSLENERALVGGPRQDFARLIHRGFHPVDIAAPGSYATPSLVEGYCYMGASFARGMDRVFEGVTGQPLGEHMRRALAVLKTSP